MGLIISTADGKRIELSWDEARQYGQAQALGRLDALRHWRVNFSNLTIEHARGPEFYYVDLERCLSSAEVLDWIIQIERKRWGGGVVEELVWLLNLLLDPQAHLCGFGAGSTIPQEEIRELILNNFRKGVGFRVESGIIPAPRTNQ